ncbi:low affinity immunoglobulin gamma Fc region receptor III-A isoform X1 [Pongo abelii]|uniref:low affinity immunoglobulin gamma Fc region receptor III-A isoform X1 n=2 Tax=Pongo abelii TaxID=9601 RepID=UPI0023E83554|nr:low affinity immunoglobulin gamma Fc region receptor III-A isoform X1 [Pongo abelii]
MVLLSHSWCWVDPNPGDGGKHPGMAEGTLRQILCVPPDAQPQTFGGVKGADPPTLPPGSFLPVPVLWWGSLARLQFEKSDEVSRKGNWWLTEMGGGAGERLFTSSCLVGLVPLGLQISLVTCPLQCGIMWQLLLPTALLLLVSAGMQTEDLPKAVVFLQPQWYRVLEEDSVTLKCQGAYSSEDNSTQWFHDESLISSQASSYFIAAAGIKDSGEYRCQTSLSTLSDPVQLEVHTGWLLLQAPRWVFKEEDSIHLRCHSWKNKALHKVTYLQNGKGRKYFHQNSDFYIPKATLKDSGSYFCRGLLGNKNVSSETLNITITQGLAVSTASSFFPPGYQVSFCLVMVLLFAVDTGLYFSVKRNIRSSTRDWKDHKFKWRKDLQDK